MSELSILLPILLPLTGAIALLFCPSALAIQKSWGVIFSAATFAASLYLLAVTDANGHVVMHIGNWSPPFGISLLADRLSAVMVAVSSFMAAAVALYAISEIDKTRLQRFSFRSISF